MMAWLCDRCKKHDEISLQAGSEQPLVLLTVTIKDGKDFSDKWEICMDCFRVLKEFWKIKPEAKGVEVPG